MMREGGVKFLGAVTSGLQGKANSERAYISDEAITVYNES